MNALFFATAFLIAAVMLRLLVHSPLARFFGDVPNHRKVHQSVIPRIGGLGITLAFLAVLGLQLLLPPQIWPSLDRHLFAPLVFIGLFLVGAGTLDDVHPLDFRMKFLFQFALATGVVLLFDKSFDTIVTLGYRFDLHGLGPVLSIFWIVAVMNAFNIIDGIDGLAGGVALCGFGTIAFLAEANGARGVLVLCLALIGVTLAFLRFNFSRPYKLFLGDAGAQFLGAVLALLAMEVQAFPKTNSSFFVPLFIVGYPLFDISVAMVRRFARGRGRNLARRFMRIFAADNEHLHHRLVYLGLSHAQSTFLLLLVSGSIGATAVIISRVGNPYRIGVMAYLFVSLFLILNRLGYVGLKPWLTFPRFKSPPGKIVGVIEPDEVFFHSLKSFKQDKFEFLNLPGNLTKFMGDELIAVMLYNTGSGEFDERWTMILRASEYQDCPAIVIADAQDVERVRALKPEGFSSIHFMEKPVRVPDLVRELEAIAKLREKKVALRGKQFSLAELAVRNNAGK